MYRSTNISYSTSKMLEFNKRIWNNRTKRSLHLSHNNQASPSIHDVYSLRNGRISQNKKKKKLKCKYQPFSSRQKITFTKTIKEAKHVNSNWYRRKCTHTHTNMTLIAFLPRKCGQLFSQRENAKKSHKLIDLFSK